MDYKNDIKKVTNSKYLTIFELVETITILYGTQDKENKERVLLHPDKADSILLSILGTDGKTAAVSFYNSNKLQEFMDWKYDVESGEGYFFAK